MSYFAVVALVVWVFSLAFTIGGYLIGKKGLSRWRTVSRVLVVSAAPALLGAAIFSILSRSVGSPADVSVGQTPPASPSGVPSGSKGSPPLDAQDDRLQQAVDGLPLGDVVFQHPAEMQLRKQETVQVRISQDQKTDLLRGLPANGITERDQIKISTSMKVRLSGDPNFEIRPLTDEEQLVTKKNYTEWSFTVLPLRKGNWPLHLVVTAVIRTPWGTEKSKDYPVKDEFVLVRVTPFHVIEYFVGDNWQWILTAILIPLVVWAWKRRVKPRRKKAAAASTPKIVPSVKTSASTTGTEAAVITKPEEKREQTAGEKSA
jgi:hypothetical protein